MPDRWWLAVWWAAVARAPRCARVRRHYDAARARARREDDEWAGTAARWVL